MTLTLTRGDLFPDPANVPDVLRVAGRLAASGQVPRRRLARAFGRGLLRLGPRSGDEPELPAGIATLATLLRERGYHVALKGKWHLTKPLDGERWGPGDPARIERDFGFADWDPTDAGGDAKASSFGGGIAGLSGRGWDEDYTRQMEGWLGRADLPEPFCLVWCLVNPHDVLGYPSAMLDGGYSPAEFADLHVPLPATIDEDLRDKPTVHAMTKIGQTSYLGGLRGRAEQQRYADFYAHLHRVVDEKLGRLVTLLGDPGDPASLRSRTVVVRTSDHGELGLSHGGLRQKMFNAYEEAIRVPLVVSSPVLFPEPRTSDALVSLVDLVPTLLGLSGAPGDPAAFDGIDLGPVLRGERDGVRDAVLFTYDDHQAGTFMQEAPGQPNRIRCVRDRRWKYAIYVDPAGTAPAEYELYDLQSDPDEALNLLDKWTGRGRNAAAGREAVRLHAELERACAAAAVPGPTPAPAAD
ncbi:sulfatase-like hydrolase/transferase [Baekduia soli]|uniref:sulfatase-like hydrolase/transferase n=1 Tax=Baekduia soli TaxID=496014 RepID=UPI001651FE27|nr:sulfatase-like hydrolase/transferase [Baekduia soli]